MKKISLIWTAIALLLMLVQCKKNSVVPDVPELVGEKYPVSLTLGGKPDAKADVYPFDNLDIAPVYYSIGDKIQVVYKGIRVGEIECKRTDIPSEPEDYLNASADFEGEVTIDAIDGISPLYFYFLGNKPYGDTEGKFIVDISDQSDQLPVISYAASKEAFAADRTKYTIWNGYNHEGSNWLLNQCALVKFECENIYDMSKNTYDNNPYAVYKTTQAITIYGMDNHVEIDLSRPRANDQFVWSQVNGGAMTLRLLPSDTEGSTRYAIVHHKDYTGVTEGALDVKFDPERDPYGMYGTYKIDHNVVLNEYFDGGKLDLVWHSGAFSVAAAADPASAIDPEDYGTPYYIVFSRGNLQYNNNQDKWRFAKHQYDFVGGGLDMLSLVIPIYNYMYIGNVVLDENDASSPSMSSNSNANRSDNEQINNNNYSGWIDLYGWGTGDSPMKCRQENSYYSAWHEWGDHPIANDGTATTSDFWYTLGHDEWQYLIEHRCGGASAAASRIGLAVVEGVKGMILLPDIFNAALMPPGCPAWEEAGSHTWVDDSWNMTFNAEQWKSMEQRGAVFFPAAGYRGSKVLNLYSIDFDGGGPTGSGGSDQDHGAYWSSTKDNSSSSFELRFGNNMVNNHVNPGYYMAPDNGHAVRLAHKVNSSKSFLYLFNK